MTARMAPRTSFKAAFEAAQRQRSLRGAAAVFKGFPTTVAFGIFISHVAKAESRGQNISTYLHKAWRAFSKMSPAQKAAAIAKVSASGALDGAASFISGPLGAAMTARSIAKSQVD